MKNFGSNMEKKYSNITKQIFKEDLLAVLYNRYSAIGPIWTNQQMQWANGIYQSFKDHDKFLLIVYLIKNTLDFYSHNFVKLSYTEFYSHDTVLVGKFNIIELSKALGIPKESTRRKFNELEKIGIIKKVEGKTIIDRSAFPLVKPIKSTIRMARFLATFSKLLVEENILSKPFVSEDIEMTLKENYSYVWKIYYEMQVPMLLSWKTVFKDLESWHIWAVCVVAQHLDLSAKKKGQNYIRQNRDEFINEMLNSDDLIGSHGINAMSISDITGIPRATVIRKLGNLVKLKHLKIDSKKHYTIMGVISGKKLQIQKNTMTQLAKFSTIIYNLMISVEQNKYTKKI